MSNIQSSSRAPRVLFFGMQGNFSPPALTALLDSGVRVCAVVIPAMPLPGNRPPAIGSLERPRLLHSRLPLTTIPVEHFILDIAREHQLPVWEVHRLADATSRTILSAYQPDIICVACFSLRIPRSILELPPLGCLNVHPSLLPANRGPQPLFWTFYHGVQQTGVTVHLMNESIDSGPIFAQAPIAVPDGMSHRQLEAQCAAKGGELLKTVVWNLYEGHATSVRQDESRNSYHSFPTAADCVMYAEEWSARHIYNFIRGVREQYGPLQLRVGEASFLIREGISYSDSSASGEQAEKYHIDGKELVVQCKGQSELRARIEC